LRCRGSCVRIISDGNRIGGIELYFIARCGVFLYFIIAQADNLEVGGLQMRIGDNENPYIRRGLDIVNGAPFLVEQKGRDVHRDHGADLCCSLFSGLFL
jgi:hypothetical protein